MLTFKITSLWHFGNILVKISPNNKKIIFLKSTQKGLLKNAQDGISRPLGSREIQKNKSGNRFGGHPVGVPKWLKCFDF